MVRESNPSQSCQLFAQHEALTDKLTIRLKKVKKKNDRISFDFSDKLAGQLRRCTADLNRLARIDRIIDKKQTLYSVDTNREAGYIEVIRNY